MILYDWTAATDKALASVEGLTDAVAAERLHVSESTVNRWRELRAAGEQIPEPRKKPRAALLSVITGNGGSASEADSTETLDQWGFARARAVEGLVEMLREDKRILEMRAETALNASRAALLEAEKAPHRGVSLSSDQTEALHRLVEDLMSARKAAEEGDGGPSTGGPEPPGQQRPDGKG